MDVTIQITKLTLKTEITHKVVLTSAEVLGAKKVPTGN